MDDPIPGFLVSLFNPLRSQPQFPRTEINHCTVGDEFCASEDAAHVVKKFSVRAESPRLKTQDCQTHVLNCFFAHGEFPHGCDVKTFLVGSNRADDLIWRGRQPQVELVRDFRIQTTPYRARVHEEFCVVSVEVRDNGHGWRRAEFHFSGDTAGIREQFFE